MPAGSVRTKNNLTRYELAILLIGHILLLYNYNSIFFIL
jgi:hypothetical protein